MNSPNVLILGAGGHAKVVADAVRQQAQYSLIGFWDVNAEAGQYMGLPIIKDIENVAPGFFVVAIGHNKTRQERFDEMVQRGWIGATIIHPSAILAPDVRIGAGTVVLAGVVINIDATIGENCIINTAASIDHDCKIGSHVHIAPGCNIAGTVEVGDGAFLGIGTKVIPSRRIGQWATAGAGSVVIRDIESGITAVGVPAKALKA